MEWFDQKSLTKADGFSKIKIRIKTIFWFLLLSVACKEITRGVRYFVLCRYVSANSFVLLFSHRYLQLTKIMFTFSTCKYLFKQRKILTTEIINIFYRNAKNKANSA